MMKRDTFTKVLKIDEVVNGYVVDMTQEYGDKSQRYVFTTYSDFVEFVENIGREGNLL